jgi:hypothetical protein
LRTGVVPHLITPYLRDEVEPEKNCSQGLLKDILFLLGQVYCLKEWDKFLNNKNRNLKGITYNSDLIQCIVYPEQNSLLPWWLVKHVVH